MPAESVRHFYDRRGRLVRSVTVREPLYTEQDRAELFALALYREGLCPLCRRPLRVCTAPEDTYRIDTSWDVCQATRKLIEQQNAAYKGEPHPFRSAHLWGTTISKG